MLNQYKDILSVDEFCEALGIGRSLAYRLLKSGAIKSVRIGRYHKIPKIYVIDYLCGNSGSDKQCESASCGDDIV